MKFEFLGVNDPINCYECGESILMGSGRSALIEDMNLHDTSLMETLEKALRFHTSYELELHLKKLKF